MFALHLTDAWRQILLTAGRMVVVVVVAIVFNAMARRAVGRLATTIRTATRELDARVPGTLIRAEARQRAEARANTVTSVLRSVASTTIYLITVLVLLGELHINLAPLVAGAGVASIAVGFGAQSLVRDVVSGVFVLLEDQYGVGDTIDAGPAVGVVQRVTLRVTRLQDASGTVWHIPNGTILRVGNKSQNWARAVVDVTVSPAADLRTARDVLARVAGELAEDPDWTPSRISGSADEQGVQAFTPQGPTLRVVIDSVPPAQWAVERELRQRIKEAFDAAGLPLAFSVQ